MRKMWEIRTHRYYVVFCHDSYTQTYCEIEMDHNVENLMPTNEKPVRK